MKFSSFIAFIALLPLAAQNYEPLTAKERLKWFGKVTYGPRSLLVSGPISSAWQTYTNQPQEWGPHWEGFGKRYGARLVNISVTNGLEGSFGAIWKEDPRYFRTGEGSVRKRLGGVLKQTWMSRYGNGEYHFGAAKAIGITGGSLFQKAWMPDSVASNRDVVDRIWGGYAGRLLGNFLQEFTPDLMRKFKKKN